MPADLTNNAGDAAGRQYAQGLHQAFEAAADRAPAALAVVDHRQRLTYAELDRQADGVAAHLGSLGVAAGQPVGVHVGQSAELAVAALGVLKAGGACLPLDPAYPAERLDWMVSDAGATVVITAGAGPVPGAAAQVVSVEEARAFTAPGRLPFNAGRESPAYIIYTSGSTGRPKGVVLAHRGLVNHQHACVALYGLVPGDAVLHLGSIGFDISIEAMFPTWAAGARVVFRADDAPLSGAAFLSDLERLGITVLDLPTAFWHQWARDLSIVGGRVPPGLRAVIVGGERASASTFARWRQHGGDTVRWFNTYGPTEASVIATAWEAPRHLPGDLRDLPIGRAIEGVRALVLLPGGAPAAPGQEGELYIAGAGVALGYLNRPELTAERFVPEAGSPGSLMYRTGDIVAEEGGQLYFRGRSDDQVKIRGFRVEPGEVEAALVAQPGVDQAVVVARPGPGGEQRLLAYVVARSGQQVDPNEVLRLLPERLPIHMVPSAVTVVGSLPLTANGKVDKAALPDVARAERRLAEPAVPPRDATDRALTDIWEEVLGVSPVGIDDDFFALGGHSLAAVRSLAMIEWLTSVEVPMRALLEKPTVRQIADQMRSGGFPAERGVLQALATEGDGPPLVYVCTVDTGAVALRHLLPFLGPGQPVYAYVLRRAANLPGASSVEGLAGIGLAELGSRHPSSTYRLAGYSIGGLVAYEMAQRLTRDGAAVDLLALLDTWAPAAAAQPGPGGGRKAAALARRGASLLVRDPKQLARALVGQAQRRGGVKPDPAGTTLGPDQGRPLPADRAGDALLDDESLSAIYRAYQPAPYPGRVLLLSTQSSVRTFGGPWLGWQPANAAAWHCAPIPGEHGNLMFQGNAEAVGRALATAISGPSR